MRDIALLVAIVGLLPVIIRRPEIGILTWNWLTFMNPHRLTWGFAYGLPWNQLVALATLGAILFSSEKNTFPWSKLVVVWIVFVVWVNMTTILAAYPGDAFPEWDRFMKVQLLVFVTLLVMQSGTRIRWLVWVVTLSIGFYGIKGGYFAIITGGQFRVWGPASSFIGGNNEIALALIIVLPLMWFLRQSSENRWIRLALLVSVGLCFVAVISSYSRGAFLAGAVMLLFLILKSRQKLIFGPVLIVLALGAVMFMPEQWADRMGTISSYEEDGSAMGRINAWKFAFNLAKDHPLAGGGFGAFQPELFLRYAPNPNDFHDAHSIYFEVLAEHGFVGLFLYLTMAVGVLVLNRSTESRAKKLPGQKWVGDLAAMVQVSFIGFGVGGAFLGLAYFDLPYQLFAISVLLNRLIVKKSAESAPSAEKEKTEVVTRAQEIYGMRREFHFQASRGH